MLMSSVIQQECTRETEVSIFNFVTISIAQYSEHSFSFIFSLIYDYYKML